MKSKADPWYATPQVIVSLRPQGGHESVRHAARRHGARVLALSPWKLKAHDDTATRTALRAALAAPRVLFTSPAAVQFASVLMPLKPRREQLFLTVGIGTARVLQHLGVSNVIAPQRMDSEGFLALPQLQSLHDSDFGLVTAPEGRDLISSTLRERGARLLRADVYTRARVALSSRALAKLDALDVPARILISSGGALDAVLMQLNVDQRKKLLALPAVTASARLTEAARAAGFAHVRTAAGPLPAQMLASAVAR